MMSKEYQVILALEKCHTKWRICISSMVGNLYPAIVRQRYLIPLQVKISDLHWKNPRYKNVDFNKAWMEANNRLGK